MNYDGLVYDANAQESCTEIVTLARTFRKSSTFAQALDEISGTLDRQQFKDLSNQGAVYMDNTWVDLGNVCYGVL